MNSIISELRDNGLDITCRCVNGRKGIYEYILEETNNDPPRPTLARSQDRCRECHPALAGGEKVGEP